MLQVKIPQRATLPVAYSRLLKVLRESGCADDARRQWRFIDKQEVINEFGHDLAHRLGTHVEPPRSIRQRRHQVECAALMLEHHERHDVAVGGRVSSDIELIPQRVEPSLPYSVAAMSPAA